MKVNDFLRLCELQRQMQEDPYVSEEDLYAPEDEFVFTYGELPSCHVSGETGNITFQYPYHEEYYATPTHPQSYLDPPSIHLPQPLPYESQYTSQPHPVEFEYTENFCPTSPHYEPYPSHFSRSPEDTRDHISTLHHFKAAHDDFAYINDYDDNNDVHYDSDDMDEYPARPTTTPTRSTCQGDESQAAPPTPICATEEILDPMTHHDEDNDDGEHDQDHTCDDGEGLPVPDDKDEWMTTRKKKC